MPLPSNDTDDFASLAAQLGDRPRPRGLTEESAPSAPPAFLTSAAIDWASMSPATPRSCAGMPDADLVQVRLARGTFLASPATMDAPAEEFAAPALLRVTRDDAATLQRAGVLA